MTDIETDNILAIKDYFSTNETSKNVSKVISLCYADVFFEGLGLPPQPLNNTEVIFEHGYNVAVKIPSLRPPYYGEFWTSHQIFHFDDGTLTITGESPNGLAYKVTVV